MSVLIPVSVRMTGAGFLSVLGLVLSSPGTVAPKDDRVIIEVLISVARPLIRFPSNCLG